MKYLFSGTKPTIEDNLKFKARKRAVTPSSCYVIGRLWYSNGLFDRIEHIGNVSSFSGISRGSETETVWNGITYTNLPKLSGNKPITLTTSGGNTILEDWYSRVESRSSAYACDTVLLILEHDFKHYVRCYGFKNSYISNLLTGELGKDNEEEWGLTFTLEHSGVRAIDPGENITLVNVDNNTEKEYIKSTKGFYAEKVVNTISGNDAVYDLFTHFNTAIFQ
jgi:hypothetical protein